MLRRICAAIVAAVLTWSFPATGARGIGPTSAAGIGSEKAPDFVFAAPEDGGKSTSALRQDGARPAELPSVAFAFFHPPPRASHVRAARVTGAPRRSLVGTVELRL